jgi:hypothetical protein
MGLQVTRQLRVILNCRIRECKWLQVTRQLRMALTTAWCKLRTSSDRRRGILAL